MDAEFDWQLTCDEFVDRLMAFIAVSSKTKAQIYGSGAVGKTTLFDWSRLHRMPSLDQVKQVIIACAPTGTDGASFWNQHGPSWEHYWKRVTVAELARKAKQPVVATGEAGSTAPESRSRHSILIVEDEIGERLKRLLGDFDCEVIESLSKFWEITSRINDFDLALVDLHLQPERLDQEGMQVLEWLAGHSSVATIAMTSQTPEDLDVGNLISRYNLAGYCSKSSHLGAILQAVRHTLSEAGAADLVSNIEDELVNRGRKARLRLERRGADADAYETLERDLESVREACRTGSLRTARAAQRSLDETYGLGTR